MAKTHKVPENFCAKCGTKLSGATFVGREDFYPEAGNLSICAVCYNVTVYDADLKLVEPPAELLADPDGPGTSDEKIEKLGQAMFGDLWK